MSLFPRFIFSFVADLENRVSALLTKFGQNPDLQRRLNSLSDDLRASLCAQSESAQDPTDAEGFNESNVDDAPPLPAECVNKVINDNCGLIQRHFKPFEHIHEENGVQLFKCNYCARVIK